MAIKLRNILISIFVIGWLCLFQYESLRLFYLNPVVKKELPKVKWLFPPAGWIMFYNVNPSYGFAQVYGIRGASAQLIEPHEIFRTRAIMYDNIRRNALVSILSPGMREQTCKYLKWRFPGFERFAITYNQIPDVTKKPYQKLEAIAYECS